MAYVKKKDNITLKIFKKGRKKIKVYIPECPKKKKREKGKSLTLFNH